ncbi:MAG: methyltransferase domain-containing protein [Planctomycetes bacterium]|nr:methyltransferase domain-containing protein [Planctomycetota bacterium]
MPGVPEAREDPRLRRFPLRRLRLPVGSGQVSLVVPDERAWMREGSWAPAVVRGKEPPYWIRIWPAALAAARTVHRLGSLEGLRVLDLGCGLGVPGVQAAAAGAEVTFADLEADALAFATWNARNQPGCRVPPTGVVLDWAQRVVTGSFDLLLMSDVSYHGKHHGPLRRHLDSCLGEGGAVLHADPHRELATTFLAGVARDHVMLDWSRPTAVQDRRAEVRLTLAARSAAILERWRSRLGPVAGSPARTSNADRVPAKGRDEVGRRADPRDVNG